MESNPENFSMEKKPTILLLGDVLACKGRIEPGPDQQEHVVDEFAEELGRGKFYEKIPGDVMMLLRCVDGRSPADLKPLAPNSAGGTESLFVADDLTTRRFAGEDGTTLAGYTKVVNFLRDAGHEVGGHTSSHAHGDASGCGANDELAPIYSYIVEQADSIKAAAGAIGAPISDETMDLIVRNARARSAQLFSKGSELLDVLKENAKADYLDVLEGDHKEAVGVVNFREGTTLNRAAIRQDERFGDDYQAFNIDAWAFRHATEVISVTPEEVEQKIAALLVYNLATTAVLAGGKLRVTVQEPEMLAA